MTPRSEAASSDAASAAPTEAVTPTLTKGLGRIAALTVLAALLGLAATLRAWGIGWGLPGPERFYPGHPDESVLLLALCNVNPLWGDVSPTFYNYGSLLILLTRTAFDLATPLLGWNSVPKAEPFPTWVNDFAQLLLVGRVCNVVLSTLGVALLAWIGTRLYSFRAGWLAALMFAVAPLPVILGHYLTVDMPATTLCLAVLAAAAGALHADDRRFPRWLLAGGIAAGLAAGTKYNAGLVLLVLAVPCWARATRHAATERRLRWDWLPWGALAAVAAAVAFVASTPGVLLETAKFQEDLSYELWRNREGQGLIFRGTSPALSHHLGISLPVGLEWPLYLIGMAGLRWLFHTRRPADALLLLFLAVTFLPLLPAERKFIRYIAPIIPIFCLMAARLIDDLLAAPPMGRTRMTRPMAAGAAVLAVGAALASTVAHLGVLSAPDARDSAAAYLRSAAGPGDVVALGADPWYYTPPLDPSAGCVKAATPFGGPPVWDRFPNASRPLIFPLGPYQVLAPDSMSENGSPAGALPVSRLRETRPRFVILTDYEYEDPERLRRKDPTYQSGVLDLMAALKEGYHLDQEFRPRPSLAGFTWWRKGIPPHDWRYFMPTVRIYARN